MNWITDPIRAEEQGEREGGGYIPYFLYLKEIMEKPIKKKDRTAFVK